MCEVLEKDLYAVLGACPSDTAQQLKHKYQELALQYHPDRLRLQDSSAVDSALKKFLEIDAAWKILRDQNTRRQYDLGRRGTEAELASRFYCLSGKHDLGSRYEYVYRQLSLWRSLLSYTRGGGGRNTKDAK